MSRRRPAPAALYTRRAQIIPSLYSDTAAQVYSERLANLEFLFDNAPPDNLGAIVYELKGPEEHRQAARNPRGDERRAPTPATNRDQEARNAVVGDMDAKHPKCFVVEELCREQVRGN